MMVEKSSLVLVKKGRDPGCSRGDGRVRSDTLVKLRVSVNVHVLYVEARGDFILKCWKDIAFYPPDSRVVRRRRPKERTDVRPPTHDRSESPMTFCPTFLTNSSVLTVGVCTLRNGSHLCVAQERHDVERNVRLKRDIFSSPLSSVIEK